jgi:hypothetical protein
MIAVCGVMLKIALPTVIPNLGKDTHDYLFSLIPISQSVFAQ